MFNVAFPGWLEVHKQIRAAYTPLFRQIVYTGFHRQVCFLVNFSRGKICLACNNLWKVDRVVSLCHIVLLA